MKDCSFRRRSTDPDRVICLNTKQIMHTGTVSKLLCEDCCFARIISYEEQCALLMSERPVCSVCEEVDTVPVKQQDKSWCVVITTAPRPIPTIKRTIASVRVMHLEPVVFAEPDSVSVNAHTIHNETRKGVWDNWRQAAEWALKNTNAETILMLQDDVAIHPQTKRVIQQHLWPSSNTGFISLYTPAHYQKNNVTGLHRVRTRALWGACAMLWPREVLESVLQHDICHKWIGVPPARNRHEVMANRKRNRALIQNSDTAIGRIMNAMGKEMWFVTPSPAQHIATTSAINHGGNKGKRNCHHCADSKKPLREQLRLPERKAMEPIEYSTAVQKCVAVGMSPTFAVSADLWQAIRSAVTPNMRTAEFGSGVSTFAFEGAMHTAFEQDRRFLSLHRSIVYSPIIGDWYKTSNWGEQIPKVLLIDAPHRSSRLPAWKYAAAVIAAGGTVFIDDANRDDCAEIVRRLKTIGANISHHASFDKAWCVATP